MTTKQELFKTARALISCAHFKAGDIVSVKLMYPQAPARTPRWYLCNDVVAYPEYHLTDFVL